MFHELVEKPGEYTPEELYESYLDELQQRITSTDLEEIAEATELDRNTLRGIVEGDNVEVTLSDAASILAATDGNLEAEEVEAIARDDLLLGMSMAVLDVERISSGLGGELEPREIQSKTEGRFPMTLQEYALLKQYIESHRR